MTSRSGPQTGGPSASRRRGHAIPHGRRIEAERREPPQGHRCRVARRAPDGAPRQPRSAARRRRAARGRRRPGTPLVRWIDITPLRWETRVQLRRRRVRGRGGRAARADGRRLQVGGAGASRSTRRPRTRPTSTRVTGRTCGESPRSTPGAHPGAAVADAPAVGRELRHGHLPYRSSRPARSAGSGTCLTSLDGVVLVARRRAARSASRCRARRRRPASPQRRARSARSRPSAPGLPCEVRAPLRRPCAGSPSTCR